jgi:hypothetical protein
VQPCGEPCGSAAGFDVFDYTNYLNRKKMKILSLESMAMVSVMCRAREVWVLNMYGINPKYIFCA